MYQMERTRKAEIKQVYRVGENLVIKQVELTKSR
jgi:hypothetical protein